MTYRLTPTAVWQLQDIYDWSVQHWGLNQAEAYVSALDAAMRQIVENPSLARPAPELDRRLSVRRVKSHRLFVARLHDGSFVLAAVLHIRMDAGRRLRAQRDIPPTD